MPAGGGELSRRATEARYQMLFEGAAEAILLVALPGGTVDEANPRALALLRLAEDEVVGRPVASLVAEADRDRIAGMVAAVAERGEVPPSRLTLASCGRRVSAQGRAFRAFDRGQLMLRLEELDGHDKLTPAETQVARLMRGAGQALALADAAGRIIWASESFPDPAEGVGESSAGRAASSSRAPVSRRGQP